MKRLYSLLLVLVLTLATVGAASAQDVACGDLSDDACDLAVQSLDAMNLVSSGVNSINVELNAENAPMYGDLSFSFSLDQSFSYNEAGMEAAMMIEEMSPSELSMLFSDPMQLSGALGELLGNTSMTLSLATMFSPELAALTGMALDAPGFPEEVVINLAIDGGILYVDLAPLAPLLEDAAGGMPLSGWIGLELMPLLQQALMSGSIDANSAAMAGASAGSDIGAGVLYAQLSAADPSGSLIQFFDIEGTGMSDMDGEEVANFVTTVDFDTLLGSSLVEQAVMVGMAQAGQMMTMEEVSQVAQLVRAFAPAILDAVTVELVEMVGADSGYLLATDFVLDVDLEALANAGLLGGMSADGGMVSLSITTDNMQLGEEIDVAIPTGAFVIPQQMLEQMLSGGF